MTFDEARERVGPLMDEIVNILSQVDQPDEECDWGYSTNGLSTVVVATGVSSNRLLQHIANWEEDDE